MDWRNPRDAQRDISSLLTFWTYGYAGTSIADLVESTQLLRGSIYHTFGDKRSLYIQTLERYGHMTLQQATAFWSEAEPSLGNFRAFLMVIVDLPEAQKRLPVREDAH